ncbi:MAG TPA: DciA family protein [Casimicrobiaceae bacterium]|nr:DciA family protein [Casimicrobiaceae bacterium]
MRRLSDVIRAEAALASAVERRSRELAVAALLRKLLPPTLGSQTSVGDASTPELLLLTASGAATALLRHHAPKMLEGLTREGWKFTGIRIRVQARTLRADRSKVYAKQMDRLAAAALRHAAAGIADPALAAALLRLAGRAEGGSEDEEQPLEGIEGEHSKEKK